MTNARAQSKVNLVLFEQRTNWIKHMFRLLQALTMLETPQSWGIRRNKPMPCRNSVAKTTCLNKSSDSDAPISCKTCTLPAHASLVRDMHASMKGPSCAAQTGVHTHPIQTSTVNSIMQLLWTSQKMRSH